MIHYPVMHSHRMSLTKDLHATLGNEPRQVDIGLDGPRARPARRLSTPARYRRTQQTCAHPVDASYWPGDPNRRARGAENSDLWQFSTSGPWRLPTGCPSAPRRGARSPRTGHVWKASRRGSGAEVWRAGLPRAPAERLRDDAPKRSTRRRWTPGLALGAVGLGFRAGGADHRRGQLEVLGADRNVDPARAGGGRERASGALWRAAKVAPGAGRRARLWRRWAVRRGRGRRNRSARLRRAGGGARSFRPRTPLRGRERMKSKRRIFARRRA